MWRGAGTSEWQEVALSELDHGARTGVLWIGLFGDVNLDMLDRLRRLDLPLWSSPTTAAPSQLAARMDVVGQKHGKDLELAPIEISLTSGPGWIVSWVRGTSASDIDDIHQALGDSLLGSSYANEQEAVQGFAVRLMDRQLDLAQKVGHEVAATTAAVYRELLRSAGPITARSAHVRLLQLRVMVDALAGVTIDLGRFRRLEPVGDDAAQLRYRRDELANGVDRQRRDLHEAMQWIVSEESVFMMRTQRLLAEQGVRRQQAVQLVSGALLGPGLVAAVFGAMPGWWEGQALMRFSAMGCAMFITGLTIFAALRPSTADTAD